MKGRVMSKMILAVGLLAASLAVRAQAPASPVPPVPHAPPVAPAPPQPSWTTSLGVDQDVMMFMSSELGGRGVTKGAPYAATAVSESRQVLSDGNRIERSSTIKLARDSKGRTRQEHASGTVLISDVVAGKRYVLNTQKKTARERAMPRMHVPDVPPVPPAGSVSPPQPPAHMSADEARSWAEEMRRWAREFADRMRGERQVIIARSETGGDQPQPVTQQVEVIRFDDGHEGRMPLPSLMPMAHMSMPGPGTKTTLGSRDFDGVRAEGTKTTWTIPAGQIGNKLPIEVVSERWYSPELKLVVSSRHNDPRSGERTYRLENIRRGEPSADLFQVPADYELKAAPDRSRHR
jgi:hypothetical protein